MWFGKHTWLCNARKLFSLSPVKCRITMLPRQLEFSRARKCVLHISSKRQGARRKLATCTWRRPARRVLCYRSLLYHLCLWRSLIHREKKKTKEYFEIETKAINIELRIHLQFTSYISCLRARYKCIKKIINLWMHDFLNKVCELKQRKNNYGNFKLKESVEVPLEIIRKKKKVIKDNERYRKELSKYCKTLKSLLMHPTVKIYI